jgi:hypothetical protein
MMQHHAAAFRAAPADLQPIIATLALRMAMNLPAAPLAITFQPVIVPKPEPIEYRFWEHQGPTYPKNLGSDVARYRSLTHAGLKSVDADVRRAYGEAVCAGIRKLQRSELLRCLTPTPSMKAHTGLEILASVRAQQAAALSRCPGNVATQDQYESAMAEKRKRSKLKKAA